MGSELILNLMFHAKIDIEQIETVVNSTGSVCVCVWGGQYDTNITGIEVFFQIYQHGLDSTLSVSIGLQSRLRNSNR